jgi:apolipoprotein N-acyltransferase
LNERALWRLAATVASVVLCRLTGGPFHCWLVVPCCWAPLVVALERATFRESLGFGLLHGTLLNAAAFPWLIRALVDVGELSLPVALAVFVLLVLVQGGRSALLAATITASERAGLTAATAFPFALVVSDYVYPYVFPWQTAIFTVRVPAWMQLAEFGGPLALSLWVGCVNAALVAAWLERKAGTSRWLVRVAGGLALLAGVTLVGRYLVRSRSARLVTAPTARVAVVQGNAGATLGGGDPVPLYRARTLQLLASDPAIDWVLWPETTLSVPTPESQLHATLRDFVLQGDESGAKAHISKPLLLGMIIEADGPKRGSAGALRSKNTLTNSAVLSDSFGRVLGRYDKRELVPFGEQDALPSLPFMHEALRAVTSFARGPRRPPIVVQGHPIAVSICYEDILRESFRESVVETDPELLVNLTSDSWFAGSAAPDLHFALSTLRAVEHRRDLIRATETGISAVIDATGEVVWRLPENETVAAVAPVHYLRGVTLYERWGDWPWTILTVMGGAGLALRGALRRTRAQQ